MIPTVHPHRSDTYRPPRFHPTHSNSILSRAESSHAPFLPLPDPPPPPRPTPPHPQPLHHLLPPPSRPPPPHRRHVLLPPTTGMSAASSSHPPPLPLTEPRSSLAAAADSPRINSTIDTPVLSPQPWSPLDAQAADFRAQCRTAVLPNLARLRPHWLSMPPEHYRRRGRHYGPLHCQGQADLVTSPPRLPTPSPSTVSPQPA